MPGRRLLSVDPFPIFRRNVLQAPHSTVEKIGMEGSVETFKSPHVPVLSQEIEKRNRKSEAEKPMSVTFTENKAHCSDCNRPTHLQWTIHDMIVRICQGCAKWKGQAYRDALNQFLKAIE